MSTLLDRFTRQYITTALWASTDENGNPLDRELGEQFLAPEARKQMEADCADFFQAQIDPRIDQLTAEQIESSGHDFWLTRNCHGAGFWDGDYPEPLGTELTDASHAYGSCDLYVGDNGLIYAT